MVVTIILKTKKTRRPIIAPATLERLLKIISAKTPEDFSLNAKNDIEKKQKLDHAQALKGVSWPIKIDKLEKMTNILKSKIAKCIQSF